MEALLYEDLRKYQHKNLIKRAISEIQGMAAAFVYDGIIEDSELQLLIAWVNKNADILSVYPLDRLKELLINISADGIITLEERKELLSFLDAIACNPEGDPVAKNIFDDCAIIRFYNREFVFTGKLQFGSRELAAQKAAEHGGLVYNDVRITTDFLVVGSMGSEFWLHNRFGRKIEKALEIKKTKNKYLCIVRESKFIDAYLNNFQFSGM